MRIELEEKELKQDLLVSEVTITESVSTSEIPRKLVIRYLTTDGKKGIALADKINFNHGQL